MPVRLLVSTSYRTPEGFREFQAARQLAAALDRRGIAWELRQPWRDTVDLGSFDAVLNWTYRHTWGGFLAHAARLEERAAALGLAVVNPTGSFTYLHSRDLAVWARRGIPCPPHQAFADVEEVRLGYPQILRRDSEHQGGRMHRVGDADEARAAFAGDRGPGGREKPLDLAVEFVDTRWPDGFYRKRRAYVVGSEVIPAHAVRSESWIVNFGARVGTLASYREDKRFLSEGEPRADLLRAAVAALGADLAAVDYSPTPAGEYVFWEANRNPRMWGDKGLPAASRVREPDRRWGEALVDLVLRRVEAAAGRGGER
jgi:hypothetical protein